MRRAARALAGWGALLLALLPADCRPKPRLLRVVQSSDILTLDPNAKFEVVTDTVAMNLFDALVEFNDHMTIVPALAASWDNPDERTWRFHLRPGVKFHDGTILSSTDVVFTLERVLGDPNSEMNPFLAGVRRVRAIDPLTIEIGTAQPIALLPRLSCIYILPKGSVEKLGEKSFFAHPIGTGPYRFLSWRRGDAVSVEAFADYYGGRASIGRVDFVVALSPEERWKLVKTTRPTILLDAPLAGWDEHRRDSALMFIARPSLVVSYIGVRVAPAAGNPLADLRVRQALRLAIDPAQLIAQAAYGHGYPASQYIPPDVIGYNPDLTVPPSNPARARKLLADAGYPGGLDLPLDFEEGASPRFLSAIVSQAARGNFRLTPKTWSKDALYERVDRGLSMLNLSGWICSTGESAELFETSLHTRDPNRGLGRDNRTGYSNPDLDRLVERMLSTVDAAERQELEKQAMAVAIGDLPLIPLYIQEDRYALTRDVIWEPRADGEIGLAEVRLR